MQERSSTRFMWTPQNLEKAIVASLEGQGLYYNIQLTKRRNKIILLLNSQELVRSSNRRLWLSTIPTSSCAVSNQELPSDGSARSAMET
ncbi:hypothetical protein HPP92_026977 [Vanilla planifolia]|uniref:Uncharacterized protein n=1 Tax=Vanilla planifolia TaxID=51239 RepID=A0A835U6B6_VANPL|nr:hypothetical protein HPP92_026977 [Vanilla planifolia]